MPETITGLACPSCQGRLEIPEGTVRGRLRRGKELLEQRIAELAASPAESHATVTNVEEWAKALRAIVLPG